MVKYLRILYPIRRLMMRRIHKIFLTGCGYAVLILTMFYAFAAISKFVSTAIAPAQFVLILTFGLIIAFAEFMYEQLKLKKILKCLIHYCVLLAAFCFIFIMSGNISTKRPSAVFVAIILFTFSYFAIFAIVNFARKAINALDDKLEAKNQKSGESTQKKKGYKSLYSDGD